MNLLLGLSAIICALMTAGAQADSPLLSWSFGNQICWTNLNVSFEGVVLHTKTCHLMNPPVTTIPESTLSGEQLASLKESLSKAASGGSKTVTSSAALGATAGTLSGFDSDGKEVILANYCRNSTTSAYAILNTSPAAQDIESFISSTWKLDLPTLP